MTHPSHMSERALPEAKVTISALAAANPARLRNLLQRTIPKGRKSSPPIANAPIPLRSTKPGPYELDKVRSHFLARGHTSGNDWQSPGGQ